MTVNLWGDAAHAESYLEHRKRIPHRAEGYRVLLEFVPEDVARVLDLGCGDGEVVGRVLEARPGAEAVAADFSAEMLRRVRERFVEALNVTVVEHDLDEPLPADWGTFDAVVSAFSIHHVVDRRKRSLYAEVYERLAPGGVFLNLEHVASATPELHEAFLAAMGTALRDDDPSNQLAPVGAQLRWLRDVGFEQVDCHWKWRELALLAAVRPVENAHAGRS
jgi:tRNA (cmo5U34)-methyltransferase